MSNESLAPSKTGFHPVVVLSLHLKHILIEGVEFFERGTLT